MLGKRKVAAQQPTARPAPTMCSTKRSRQEDEEAPSTTAPADEEESDDPFAAYAAPPPTPALTQPSKRSSSTLSALFGAPTKTVPSPAATNKRAKTKASSSPSISSFFSSPSVAASSPSPSPAASSAASSPSPSAIAHQSLVDDHFNEDRTKRKAMPEFKRQLLRQQASAVTCSLCNEWIEDVTWADHQSVCKKLPPPITFFATPAARDAHKALVVQQHMPTYDQQAWSGGELLRITHAHWQAASGPDRKRITNALRWLVSMLNSDGGRVQPSESTQSDAAEETTESPQEDPDSTVQSAQELWLYLLKSGGSAVVACAVLVNTRLDASRVECNTEVTKIKAHASSQQRSLTAFLSSPPPTASTVTDSNALSTAAPTHPPLLGIDKIAVHSRFRFGGGRQSSGATASAQPPISLAIHVLSSILASQPSAAAAGASSTLLPYDRVAFSSPTQAGRQLAVRFTRTHKFHTYALLGSE